MNTNARTLALTAETPHVFWRSKRVRYVEDSGIYISLADLKYAGAYSTNAPRLETIWGSPDMLKVKPSKGRALVMLGLDMLIDHMDLNPGHAAERKAMTREIVALVRDEVAARAEREKLVLAHLAEEMRLAELEAAKRARIVEYARRASGIPLDAGLEASTVSAADLSEVRAGMSAFDDEIGALDKRVRALEHRADIADRVASGELLPLEGGGYGYACSRVVLSTTLAPRVDTSPPLVDVPRGACGHVVVAWAGAQFGRREDVTVSILTDDMTREGEVVATLALDEVTLTWLGDDLEIRSTRDPDESFEAASIWRRLGLVSLHIGDATERDEVDHG